MEATSTRRAGLERFTFPAGSKPYFVLDLANDLPESFAGGSMDIDPVNGRITIGGYWGSRYCSNWFRVTAVFRQRVCLLHTVLALVASAIKRLRVTTCWTTANRSSVNTVFGRVIRTFKLFHRNPSLSLTFEKDMD